ncbi:MAG TPA: hypothetical protein VFC39_16615 [Acidobacteriaceae bacterium]|nr:hypothetical protein [Acidobacteriaceae bacterium]
MRAKFDAAGHYDDFEVDRVVAVDMDPNARQSELLSALEPVVDRLLKQYKAARERLLSARSHNDKKAADHRISDLELPRAYRKNFRFHPELPGATATM